MKQKSLLLTLFVLCFSFFVKAQTIDVNGVERSYIIHVPENLPDGQNVPVIIALHYLGSTAAQFESYTSLSLKADYEGFITVYPQGIGNSWNAGMCCDPAASQDVDDISFISNLIDTLIEEYPVDPGKVYLTGFSNGAIMCHALAHILSDKIAGIAAVGGLLAMDVDPPTHPVPIMHIHALDDNSVDIDGMWGYQSVYDLLDEWKTYNGITAEPDTFRNDSRIKGILYSSPDSSANIILYTSETGGHQWNVNARLGTTNRIWEFFSTGINKVPVVYDTIPEGPRKRDYKTYVPARYFSTIDTSIKYPLILAAHGWGGDAASMEAMTGLSSLADSKGFFVAYMHYLGPPPDYSWNYFMNEEKPDDIGYAKAIIDSMFSRFPIDSGKVFAVGFSDGCGMANRLPFETNGLVSATGTVGGMVTFDEGVNTLPVRMIHFHAESDPAVSYNTVRNTKLQYWLDVNGCSAGPDTLLNVKNYYLEAWSTGNQDTVVLFYTLPWSIHAWPVRGTNGMELSASSLMWEFFNTGMAIASITEDPDLSELPRDNSFNVKLIPNPANDILTVEYNLYSEDQLTFQIIQPNGKIVYNSKILHYQKEGSFPITVTGLTPGYYLLRISGINTHTTLPLIVE
jgi:polyhydroxybutyrate depolymerase